MVVVLVAILIKGVIFTNTTAKTLAYIPVDSTRKIQTLTLRDNSKNFNLTNVCITLYTTRLVYVHLKNLGYHGITSLADIWKNKF